MFELTNEQRKYLGVAQVENTWEKVKYNDRVYLYFDGDKLVKQINIEDEYYREVELNEMTAENRTILLPKTSKGKPKKLGSAAAYNAFAGIGVYFFYAQGTVEIANFTTQQTFYTERIERDGFKEFEKWLKQWIDETTENDMKELEIFKSSKRQRYKYKEGDFFAFKSGRREYGFGRILLDVYPIIKAVKAGEIKEKHRGLVHLMGKVLFIKIYKITSDTADIDINELKLCEAFPSYHIMDNLFFYGEYKIIGNLPLEPCELDFPISYSRSIESQDRDYVYLQYGLIYMQAEASKFNQYIIDPHKEGYAAQNPFRCESIGFKDSTIEPESDLRSPENEKAKKEIFEFFGLEADKGYYENYKRYLSMK
ncbi:MAG: immunity 26/phosphotriesterase HocA family protein [Oscillospiraceae bacterium]|nr:immunity 26/phosphotriesterase HocA family protein [Oscillospiraceae bacterium]